MIYVKNIDHVITFSSKTTVNVEYILVISITNFNYKVMELFNSM